MQQLFFWSCACILAGVIFPPLAAIGLAGVAIALAASILASLWAVIAAPFRAVAWLADAGERKLQRRLSRGRA